MGYWILRLALTPFLKLAYRIKVVGDGHIPRDGAVIVAANHVSFIDSLFIPLVMRRRVTFLAKAEYFDNPKVAWFFRMAGQIPIKREGGTASERALASAREVLDAGGMLAIYPEGTRSPDGRLYKGRTGVARMALACDVPVIPVGLRGTAEVQPIGAMVPRPFRGIEVRVGAPLRWSVEDGGDPSLLRRITDEIVDAIGELSGQEMVDHYAKRKPGARGGDDAGEDDDGAPGGGSDPTPAAAAPASDASPASDGAGASDGNPGGAVRPKTSTS